MQVKDLLERALEQAFKSEKLCTVLKSKSGPVKEDNNRLARAAADIQGTVILSPTTMSIYMHGYSSVVSVRVFVS